MQPIAVIGAGPMGLATAYYLTRKGRKAILLEADDRVGGMSATFDFGGLELERYYHFINLPDTELFRILDELGMQDAITWNPTRMGFWRDGRLRRWGDPISLLMNPSANIITRLRYGFHALSCKRLTDEDLRALDKRSAREWITSWVGEKGYRTFWAFLFEKKFFELTEPLSAAWIASRIRRVGNSRASLFKEVLGHLKGGTGAFLETISQAILDGGGEIRTSTPVDRVIVENGGVVALQAGPERLDVSACISTVPLPYLPAMIPGLPGAYRSQVEGVENVGVACALYRLDRAVTDNFWLNLDADDLDAPGIIEYSNLRRLDEEGQGGDAIVYVPFYMPPTHPNWNRSLEDIRDLGLACITRVNPDITTANLKDWKVFRYRYAQPVCRPGFFDRLPPYDTGIRGLLAADTTHSFPEDRSINESVRIGRELSELALSGDFA